MSVQDSRNTTISIPKALKTVGIIGGVWAILSKGMQMIEIPISTMLQTLGLFHPLERQ